MRRLKLFVIIILIISLISGCSLGKNQTEAKLEDKEIILSTTTSTENSGLLDYILPELEKDTGLKVKVIAVGTGQALEMGRTGDADVLLVHAKASEIEFVKQGFGVERIEVMYNDFVLVGPKNDPAKIKESFGSDINGALGLLSTTKTTFISRGDDSGTHKAELALWKLINIEPTGSWYISVGQGMSKALQMADELEGYTLSDRATYLSMRDTLDLAVVVEGDNKLFNQYGVIAVSSDKHDHVNKEGAQRFINWITSEKGQNMIAEFGKEEFGQSLFIPNAK
jgi:tungstate transport system substrate-binding protein